MELEKLIKIPSNWGVGIITENQTIKQFIKNSPAYHSELQTNDIIYQIDNKFVNENDKPDLSGKQNSNVIVKCLRNNSTITTKLKRSLFLNKTWYQRDCTEKN